jgi:hypothetical protein
MTYDIANTGLTTGLMLLLEDADRIEALPRDRFNMHNTGWVADAHRGECKSPACIGGWVRAWSGDRRCIEDVGAARWGIDSTSVCKLMFPAGYFLANGGSPYTAAPAQAAQAMRNLAWSEAQNPGHGDPAWETVT